MTTQEFSNEFDVLYNNIMSNQAPGLDEYEKSVFLTKAQSEILKNYFNPKGNKYQEGFDDSEKRQIDFSTLIKAVKPATYVGSSYVKFDDRSQLFQMPSDILFVLNEVPSSIQPIVDLFKGNPDYEDMIINSQQALDAAGGNCVLVVVDVNKPSITECPDLLRVCKSVVVLDHHRQGTDTIENATLSYVEPYASSASEMVSEILQYTYDNVKIRPEEADCMFSGIMVDTSNFMTKTGVRTFEAAAFLRRNGADVTRVRKLFREDALEYKAKADAVSQAEIYKQYFAISICTADDLPSPTIIGAQAANELLNIKGIKASFVLTDYQGKIYISARSIDEVNVQVIMEKMGGGGHLSTAACQMEGVGIIEAIGVLKQTIDTMLENNEI